MKGPQRRRGLIPRGVSQRLSCWYVEGELACPQEPGRRPVTQAAESVVQEETPKLPFDRIYASPVRMRLSRFIVSVLVDSIIYTIYK